MTQQEKYVKISVMYDVSNEEVQIEDELKIRREIENFYLPRQLVEAIVESGGIHTKSKQTRIGIGFLDISHYTFLSQFLSPQENQTVLNGLYSAFHWVLVKHGGYLNKIEGDSLMFHYGGPIDPAVKNADDQEADLTIARELFYTCVELQRMSSLFNSNNENILKKISDQTTINAILEAYRILKELRSGYAAASFNALFQIRIRIGASLGEVLIGNFGPDGAKQWDVIGMPVIEAKRMESSAPIGGVRITKEYFDILHSMGITTEYHRRLCKEAKALKSVYQDITFDELFQKSAVFLKDKKNASFETYSIQVNPSLPESIKSQSKLLLSRGETGADAIVDFIKYYRGNHFVIDQIEKLFKDQKVFIRKDSILQVMLPDRYNTLLEKYKGNIEVFSKKLDEKQSLYNLLSILGKLQDSVKRRPTENINNDNKSTSGNLDSNKNFNSYEKWMNRVHDMVQRDYDTNRNLTHQGYYFYNFIFPLFFANIKAAILEFQDRIEEVEQE